MKTLYNFLKTTILGGVFFLLPLVLAFLLLEKAFHFVNKIAVPFAKVLPFSAIAGIQTPYVMAVMILIAIGFFAGLIAKTSLGGRFRNSTQKLLDKIPGYTLLRVFTAEVQGGEGVSGSPVGLVDWGNDNWQWCFIVERHANGYVTIFIPGAPKPNSGSVRFLPARQIKEVSVPVSLVVKCLTQSGLGSLDLLKDKIEVQAPKKNE
jgi:uncharacterized membrane protein